MPHKALVTPLSRQEHYQHGEGRQQHETYREVRRQWARLYAAYYQFLLTHQTAQ